MKDICGKTIEDLVRKDKSLIYISSDGGIVAAFAGKYSKRHFDVGIAEQNLIGITAGLAMKGKSVIISAISSFVLLNAYLQIRNDICFPKLNIVIIGVGSGLSYGQLGYTHHSLEDIAIMNTLPNMHIYMPADAAEAELSIRDALKRGGPSYIRIGSRVAEPVVYEASKKRNIKFDRPVQIVQGKDVIIFSTGICVHKSLLAAGDLKERGIRVEVVDINSLNIYSLDSAFKMIKKHKLILSVEEHYVETGVGSLLANVFIGKIDIPFIKMGIKREFCDFAGTREELLKYYQVDETSIVETVLKNL